MNRNAEWFGVNNHREEDVSRRIDSLNRDAIVYEEDNTNVVPDSESDFESNHESDEEAPTMKAVVFYTKAFKNPKMELKMQSTSLKMVKTTVYNYFVKQGRPCKFVKQDTVRVRAKCRDDACGWVIYARKLSGDGKIEVRTFDDTHTCVFTYENPLVHSRWVAKRYYEEFRCNPKLDLENFKKRVMKENRSFFTKSQIYRTRRKVMKIVHGNETDQYS